MATDIVKDVDGGPGDKRRLGLILPLAGGALLLFLLLVWPTLYRYPGESDRFRVNRLTGKAQVYDRKAEDWRPARRGRNPGGTEGTPYDDRGPRSRGPAPGGEWWHDGKSSGSGSRGGGGSQWWYSEGGEEEARYEPPSDGSPIGSSRGRGGPGGRGGSSPIGGSRSGGQSPVGGGGSGGSPIGGD